MMPHRFTTPPRRGRTPSKPGAVTAQVQSLTRGLSILEALAKAEAGVSLTDVAQRVQLPPSTTHRLLSTLEKMGYVYQSEELGRWYVGTVDKDDQPSTAHPPLAGDGGAPPAP